MAEITTSEGSDVGSDSLESDFVGFSGDEFGEIHSDGKDIGGGSEYDDNLTRPSNASPLGGKSGVYEDLGTVKIKKKLILNNWKLILAGFCVAFIFACALAVGVCIGFLFHTSDVHKHYSLGILSANNGSVDGGIHGQYESTKSANDVNFQVDNSTFSSTNNFLVYPFGGERYRYKCKASGWVRMSPELLHDTYEDDFVKVDEEDDRAYLGLKIMKPVFAEDEGEAEEEARKILERYFENGWFPYINSNVGNVMLKFVRDGALFDGDIIPFLELALELGSLEISCEELRKQKSFCLTHCELNQQSRQINGHPFVKIGCRFDTYEDLRVDKWFHIRSSYCLEVGTHMCWIGYVGEKQFHGVLPVPKSWKISDVQKHSYQTFGAVCDLVFYAE